MAFICRSQIRSVDDLRRLEQTPLSEALTVDNTYALFAESARAFGDKTALTFLRSGDPQEPPIRWSYRHLFAGITRTANMLHRQGIGAEDVVAMLLPGCLECHLVLWGGAAAGIVQPLNPLLTVDKLAELLRAADARILVAYGAPEDADYWNKAIHLRDRIDGLRVLRVAPHDEAAPPDHAGDGDFQALVAAEPDDRLVSGRRIRGDDRAAYFHTGGTTGSPKLALHTHANQVFSAWAGVQLMGLSDQDVTINGYPLFHVAGVLPASLTALSTGVEIIIPTTTLLRNPQVRENYWRIVEKYRATALSAVPTVLAAIANVPVDGADISSIRYCRTGAASLPPELGARFERQFGLHVHEALGMTEMAGISAIRPPGVHADAGCVGFPLPFARMRIVALDAAGAPTDEDLPDGEAGMILFRSPNVFPGYLDPAETARAFTADGWLITGDIGWRDTRGMLHLTGRAKDLIIRSGHNIDPKVIEDALGDHPDVQLCAAVGAPDAYAGELPVAFAVARPGAQPETADLLEWTGARVDERPAKPKWVALLDTMPVTNVGKIYKPELRRLAAERTVREALRSLARTHPELAETRVAAKMSAAGQISVDMTLPDTVDPAARTALHEALDPLPLTIDIAGG